MANINKQILRRRIVPVDVARAEVEEAHFFYDKDRVFLKIKFLDSGGRLAAREVWRVYGGFEDCSLEALDTYVQEVEGTPGYKDELIDNGSIRVYTKATFSVDDR